MVLSSQVTDTAVLEILALIFREESVSAFIFKFLLIIKKKIQKFSTSLLCHIVRESTEGALPHDCIERLHIKYPVLNYFEAFSLEDNSGVWHRQ